MPGFNLKNSSWMGNLPGAKNKGWIGNNQGAGGGLSGAGGGGWIGNNQGGINKSKFKKNIINAFGKNDPTKYEIPQEAYDILNKTQESADLLRQSSDQMLTDADIQRNFMEAPGGGGFNANLSQAEVNSVGNIVDAGGSSISALGAIGQVRDASIGSIRDNAIQNQAMRSQNESEYKQALFDAGSANIAASQIEIGGMQEMIRQREQEFQINILDPYYAKIQKDLMMQGIEANKKPSFGEQIKSTLPWNW